MSLLFQIMVLIRTKLLFLIRLLFKQKYYFIKNGEIISIKTIVLRWTIAPNKAFVSNVTIVLNFRIVLNETIVSHYTIVLFFFYSSYLEREKSIPLPQQGCWRHYCSCDETKLINFSYLIPLPKSNNSTHPHCCSFLQRNFILFARLLVL